MPQRDHVPVAGNEPGAVMWLALRLPYKDKGPARHEKGLAPRESFFHSSLFISREKLPPFANPTPLRYRDGVDSHHPARTPSCQPCRCPRWPSTCVPKTTSSS